MARRGASELGGKLYSPSRMVRPPRSRRFKRTVHPGGKLESLRGVRRSTRRSGQVKGRFSARDTKMERLDARRTDPVPQDPTSKEVQLCEAKILPAPHAWVGWTCRGGEEHEVEEVDVTPKLEADIHFSLAFFASSALAKSLRATLVAIS